MRRRLSLNCWSQWLHSPEVSRSLHYARWKSGRLDLGVDIVSLDHRTQKPRFAVEIKWSGRTPTVLHELRGLRELAATHRLVRRPLATTRTYTGQADVDGITIEFMPVRCTAAPSRATCCAAADPPRIARCHGR
jgi:uncharacterized protein